ncbi:MAG: Rha family transcriptional regulator, partial [Clostridium sp.]|nr:Rha family transcriptional regulator [Clostridium sp.]
MSRNLLNISNNELTIDSREVAEMLGKEHSYVLREIDGSKDGNTVGIIPTLEKANFALSNYFIPSTYKAGTREYKCY